MGNMGNMGNYQKLLATLTPYSIVVSLLYLFGYWSSFDVNILEYIAISDVVKSALKPLFSALIFIVLAATLGNIISAPLTMYMPPGGGKHLPIAKYFRAILWIGLGLLLIIIFYQIFFESGGYRWLRIATLSMGFTVVLVGNASFAKEYLKHDKLRKLVVNVLASLLLYSFGWGAVDAQNVKNEDHFVSINGKETKLTYIGWAGDFLFLWDQNKNTVVAQNKSTIQFMENVIEQEKPLINLSDISTPP